MSRIIHKILYRLLPLKCYLRVVSSMLFLLLRLGWGRKKEIVEYIYHLEKLVGEGGVAIDIGANLGYYTRTLSRIVGPTGQIYAVEPVPPIFEVLNANTRKCHNVTLMNVALGERNTTVTMANDTVAAQGYFGTGQNFVQQGDKGSAIEFAAVMQRGSELFTPLQRLDLIKCDIEGYEGVVLREMLPIIERLRPIILLETGGVVRSEMIQLFESLNYQPFTLIAGKEVELTDDNGKDIIFRPLERKQCE
ncbi:MAG: FkbM family methyltransferase [Rikenellaceae bacterium]